MTPGARNLITDVAGLRVGNAEDHAIKTGVTVLTADSPLTCGAHVMGGAPGTRETDLLAPDKSVQAVDALVLSGGSAFGLDAASGVMDALAAQGRGFQVGPHRVPIVPAAILFDLINGGDKAWGVNPYRALGVEAVAAAGEVFALGTAGAGTGAIAGRLKGGLGSASLVVGGITVGALVAVNSLGNTTMGDGPEFWANPFEVDGEFGHCGAGHATLSDTFQTKLDAMERGNTTIAIVATDAKLDKAGCTRLATAAHDGLARAIVPSHTPMDGDLTFAISTGTGEAGPEALMTLGHAAAICLARATARAVYLADSAPGDLVPTWKGQFDANA
ncbi:D-aminopeptidase [Rubricella aquisinus]|uniref:D-aminopeptidase n=1 Tax=Rubricella aquisinus TaxID=2028108 RepID=A0A840WPA2_9RHOB|nr:P1 family peptidase [Rubricella aquisinus]MBB5516879.1 D-aminopeptidase [Rubricella aquisinus]